MLGERLLSFLTEEESLAIALTPRGTQALAGLPGAGIIMEEKVREAFSSSAQINEAVVQKIMARMDAIMERFV